MNAFIKLVKNSLLRALDRRSRVQPPRQAAKARQMEFDFSDHWGAGCREKK